jgi:hypothetical protein
MRPALWRGVVTGGWPINRNLAGEDMQARSRGGKIWGKRELTGGTHLSTMAAR